MQINRFKVNNTEIETVFYDVWDIDQKDVIDWELVNKHHVGKYVKFDDGSNLYAQIEQCTERVIITSGGAYRRYGLCHVAMFISKQSVYSLPIEHVHPLVRDYTPYERMKANLFLAGKETRPIKPRVRMLVKEELIKEGEDIGINSKWFIKRLRDEADDFGGKNVIGAMKMIANIYDVDIETPAYKREEHKNLPSNASRLLGKPAAPVRKTAFVVASLKDLTNIVKVAGGDLETKITEAEYEIMENIGDQRPST